MVLYYAQSQLFSHAVADAYTAFASMTPEQMEAARGSEIKMLGHFHNLGTTSATVICDSPRAELVYNWCLDYTGDGLAKVEFTPIVTEDEMRAILLKMDSPPFVSPFIGLDAPLEEGESLFKASWKAIPGKKAELHDIIKNLSP